MCSFHCHRRFDRGIADRILGFDVGKGNRRRIVLNAQRNVEEVDRARQRLLCIRLSKDELR